MTAELLPLIAIQGAYEGDVRFAQAERKYGLGRDGKEPEYEHGAIGPRTPWDGVVSLKEASLKDELSKNRTVVGVLKIPDEVYGLYLLEPKATIDARVARRNGVESGLSAFESSFQDWVGLLSDRVWMDKCLGLNGQAPGLETVTIDTASGLRPGLHVDSWFSAEYGSRGLRPGRLCANLGPGIRQFLFTCSLGNELEQLPSHLFEAEVSKALHRPGGLVFALEVPPGWAYIAETERLIHDGSTFGSDLVSLTYTQLGYFTPWRSGSWRICQVAVA